MSEKALMPIHMIALDLDGTLLKSDKTIGQATRETLIALEAQGHKIVIATGRILALAKRIPVELGLPCFVVACNGAVATDTKGAIVHAHVFEKTKIVEIASLLLKWDVYFHFYTDDVLYAKEYAYVAKAFSEEALKHRAHEPLKVKIVTSIDQILSIKEGIYKFGIVKAPHYDFEGLRKELNAISGIHTFFSADNLLDIMADGVSKWRGIEELSQDYDIPNQCVLAFGDQENDIDMIKHAGHGVVMGNAEAHIKQWGRYVTKTNDEEGVNHFLKAYFKR